jgi:hypothetical protein
MSSIIMLSEITKGRAMSCCFLRRQSLVTKGLCNATSDWVGYYIFTIERLREEARSLGRCW